MLIAQKGRHRAGVKLLDFLKEIGIGLQVQLVQEIFLAFQVHGPGNGVFKKLITPYHDGFRGFHHSGEFLEDIGHLLDGDKFELGDFLPQDLDFPVIQAAQDIPGPAFPQGQQENGSFFSPAHFIWSMWPGHVGTFLKGGRMRRLFSFLVMNPKTQHLHRPVGIGGYELPHLFLAVHLFRQSRLRQAGLAEGQGNRGGSPGKNRLSMAPMEGDLRRGRTFQESRARRAFAPFEKKHQDCQDQ